jgi:hypothetical protein
MSAITSAEILLKRSVVAAAGNTTAQPDPNASLGDQVSTTQWAGGSVNDLFDDVSGAENANSDVEYRCIFVHNTNGANVLENAVVWLQNEVAGGATIAIGADPTAASAAGAGAAQAVTVADENTAPAGVAFSSPTTAGSGVSLGNIGVGQVKAFWIRRTAANTVALSGDGVTIAVTGDTGSL